MDSAMTRLPARLDLVVPQGADWYVPFRLLDAAGSLVDTTGYTARMDIRRTPQAEDPPNLYLSTGTGRLETGYSPGKWAASTAYAVGQRVVPGTPNGWVYEATVAGTTGGSPPTWPTTPNATVASGGATFKAVATDAEVTNLRISVPAAVTVDRLEWGVGVYDLELTDPFGHVTRLMEGRAVLSPEVTR